MVDEEKELHTDPEFRALVQPPLTESELKGLTASILKEGCRDPIVVWKGKNIIMDGHHRYDICTQYGIPFPTIELEIPDREAVKRWILKNQHDRRNQTKAGQMYMIGKTYDSQKKSVGGDRKSHTLTVEEIEMAEMAEQSNVSSQVASEPLAQVPETKTTAEKVAEEFHVSPSKVKRAFEFANAVDIISENVQNIDRDVRSKILSGEIDMTIKDIIALSEEDLEKQQRRISRALADLKTGTKAKKPKKPEKSPEEKRTFRFNNFLREMEYLTDEQLEKLSEEIAMIKGGRNTPENLFEAPEATSPEEPEEPEEQTQTAEPEEPQDNDEDEDEDEESE